MEQKFLQLKQCLEELGSVAVAYSAGVDSTFLLAVAHEVLGQDVLAITAASPANPARERNAAQDFCEQRGIRHLSFAVNELEIEGFDANPPDRCYICKKHLFAEIVNRANEKGARSVIEGSNVDDLGDYRPGSQALKELGIRSPLQECGFTKRDIRELSRVMGLPTADKPSFACLYTRFPYGEHLTSEKVRRVDDAEQYLIDLGFTTIRVRSIGDVARIETSAERIADLATPPLRTAIVEHLKSLGFVYVTIDLEGYRTGSMNETLNK